MNRNGCEFQVHVVLTDAVDADFNIRLLCAETALDCEHIVEEESPS